MKWWIFASLFVCFKMSIHVFAHGKESGPSLGEWKVGSLQRAAGMWRVSRHVGGSVPLPEHRLVAVGLWLLEVGVN